MIVDVFLIKHWLKYILIICSKYTHIMIMCFLQYYTDNFIKLKIHG